ncbi:unnamed protein product [Diamesa serratosioi]
MFKQLVSVLLLSSLCLAQDYEDYRPAQRAAPARQVEEVKAEPIAILKQINKHNEDGSYTYGYEGADGSFKIETKLATGEVMGKYGYTDADGKARVVEYGANKYGFQPSGEGITVAPITIHEDDTFDYEEEPKQQPKQQPKPKQQAPRLSRPQPQQPQPTYEQAERKPQYQAAPIQQQPRFTQQERREQQPEQYFDYQEVQAAPVRTKYTETPVPQRPQAQPQYVNSLDIVYAPSPRPQSQPQQFSRPQFTNQQPIQFPVQPEPLFAPAPVKKPIAQQKSTQFVSQLDQFPIQKPQHNPAPQQPQFSAPPQVSRFSSQSPGRPTTSVLDQLAKDYALPQGGSPALHDISFGYNGF